MSLGRRAFIIWYRSSRLLPLGFGVHALGGISFFEKLCSGRSIIGSARLCSFRVVVVLTKCIPPRIIAVRLWSGSFRLLVLLVCHGNNSLRGILGLAELRAPRLFVGCVRLRKLGCVAVLKKLRSFGQRFVIVWVGAPWLVLVGSRCRPLGVVYVLAKLLAIGGVPVSV